LVRANLAQGVLRFFITDDNFARNRNWEAIFDRLIEMREREGLELQFIIQVDTLCHLIPNFVEKAARAGCKRDTPERIARDIRTVQQELPVDLLEFFILTPLPGSADHQGRARRLRPDFIASLFRGESRVFTRPENREHPLDGLRLAGSETI
jgi:hypothetical protein